MKSINVCFYGSLREGLYNNSRFRKMYGETSLLRKSSVVLNGFELYSLGYYPAAVKSTSDKSIIVECFSCAPNVFSSIRNMEINAGYEEIIINIGNENYYMYVMDNSKVNKLKLVESGDWLKYSKLNDL